MSVRRCKAGCGEVIPREARANQLFCEPRCRDRWHKRKQRRAARDPEKMLRKDAKPISRGVSYIGKDASEDGRASARRGPGYEAFVKTPIPELILRDESSPTEAARLLDTSRANISRWMAAYAEDKANGVALANWSRDDEVEDALLSLRPFMERFHPDLLYAPFYDQWESEIDSVVGTGGRLNLLAPQRHSKTEFLIRYCQRRIANDPNICILWVSRSKEVAEESVGMLRQLLEDESFCEAVLGPGEEFKPPTRSGKSWTDEKFTVKNRTLVRKSPTVRALGIGGTVSGRDADIIIVDDPQEREDCMSPTTRDKQSRWFFTTLNARKMEHTGLALITSRRHIDDIPGQILKDHADDWRVVLYRAHDPACPLPDDDHAAHHECLLWPELRSHRFLMGQKRADPAFFECNYQNNPTADSLVLIKAEELERCKDHDRRIGSIPKGATRLVAGIDPAEAKSVAAVLWAWEAPRTYHVIDTMEADPGLRGGRQIFEQWSKRYGCREFVVEKNIAQSWWQDRELSDFCARNGIARPIEHYTSRINKMSPSEGVPKMFQDMRSDPPSVTFPYGDRESQQKMDRFLRALLLFDPDYAGNKHADDDLPMAAWFAHHHMQGWTGGQAQQAFVDYSQTAYVAGRTGYVRTETPKRRLAAVG